MAVEDRYRIIVVEDDDALRFALTSWLEYEPDMDVVAAVATGQEALDAIASAPAAVDLLLVDFGLPDMSGAELVRAARDQVPELKVFMLTGHEREAVEGEIDGLEIDGFMLKGHAPTKLLAALVDLAAGRSC